MSATTATLQKLQNWADEDEPEDAPTALPAIVTTTNKDGTKTVVSYSLNEKGQKVKSTRRIRTTVVRETVNPRVAERRAWAKFGDEKGKPPGPQFDTTTVGENIIFRPSITWKRDAKSGGDTEQKNKEEESLKDKLKDKKVRCRICEGEHFTARCPFKDSMPAPGEGTGAAGGGAGGLGLDDDADVGGAGGKAEGGLGAGGSSYVPPHLRKGGAGAGEKMAGGGKYEKDDLATLRVTNVSEDAEEGDLRAIFERYGRVVRVYLAKDRETGRAKGFAFISYADRSDAAKAVEKADGYGYNNLILRVEFAKRAT